MNEKVLSVSDDGKSTANDDFEIFIHSGEFYFGGAPAIISTVLRTRTVLTFWHVGTRTGGICHFMLPESPEGKCDMRYGDCALAEINNLAKKYKINIKELDLHLFKGVDSSLDEIKIRQEIEHIKGLLKKQGFDSSRIKVDSCFSSKIKLNLSTGKVEQTLKEQKTVSDSELE
ncbi:MAG: chemotaxis protein CheD, partial [Gammaproteobacteria bacterium]|nr:chemotaxis protein CheD [Gammaproteobacteria bacterium]